MKSYENKFPFYMYTASSDTRLVNSRCADDTMEIVQVTAGRVKIQIGTNCVEARCGDFLYIPPSMVYRVDAVDGNASVRGMCFERTIIEVNMDNFDAEVFYMFYLQSKNKIVVFDEKHPIYPTLSRSMQDAYDDYVTKDVCYKLPIRANIYLMMTALLRYYCGSRDESDRMVYHNVLRQSPIIDYIDEHFCEKIYIEQLADMVGISADYFTKMFKDSIGKTPIDYINAMRINYAMQLLYSTDMTLAQIADKTGFSSPNYFHKIFKQYMDTSPLSYRKSTK